jgi:hypothetical protein
MKPGLAVAKTYDGNSATTGNKLAAVRIGPAT